MSVNPESIINKIEFGTSRLKDRIEAINKLAEADYKIGILIAPVIMVENHGLKPSEVKLIMRIIADNEEIIAEHWNKFFNNTDKL